MTSQEMTRRAFMSSATGAAIAAASAESVARAAWAGNVGPLRYGIIGCGGRGTGAAVDALNASPDVVVTALADVFSDRLASCRAELEKHGGRAKVSDDRCYSGFDAYQKLLATDVDVVVLATSPHFRPMHFEAAIAAGKHVFVEKPVGVDPVGIRRVLAAGEVAEQRKLCVVAGTQRRHQACYREAIARVRDGAIGEVIAARCRWNMGELWVKPPQPEWSEMEWQLRNWLYFTWLSGDHIVEQHVHNLDVVNWVVGRAPVRAVGMGGRQVRTHAHYGNVFDHFAVQYDYGNGVMLASYCHQTAGCDGAVDETIYGTKGKLQTTHGRAEITGSVKWSMEDPEGHNPYVQEHIDLVEAIRSGRPVNETRAVAESTLTAILGRMSAYTGRALSWEQVLASKLDLSPAKYEMGKAPLIEVAVPGKTAFV
ncbi:MAG: Gfo/Idh/MocA family oxidoreductase [Planctomycetes bacterium]|nr:Gfo/Idh/MocA family oxidoreductase [Planctomycetota bacterium]